ncbi:hypothetical protein BIX37_15935 [Salmonella enterica]|nr:hypothetical protein [Salmonella enterica]EBR0641879.1 hypothetical protein [Salmonella enterica]
MDVEGYVSDSMHEHFSYNFRRVITGNTKFDSGWVVESKLFHVFLLRITCLAVKNTFNLNGLNLLAVIPGLKDKASFRCCYFEFV